MAAFGLAETAELAVRISLKDDLSRGIDGLTTKVGRLQTGLAKVGTGLRTAARNLAGPTLVAGGLLGFAIKGGLDDLSELESAVTSVDGAIEQMGLKGKVTGKEVADWANEIEADIGAAFDDKAITAAATTLIRFGKVTDRNLRPALEVVADLATKTGDVDSAATLLAKALADPEKAAGKLARSGVILTKAQQKQIKTMVEAGDVAGAQALLLNEVEKATEGAAEASQGKYKRAMSVLADVQEDARKALAEGFLPVLEKVAGLLSTELAKPQTLANIRQFGEGLASGLDSLIEIARKLPWGTIGDSLKIAGAGAKAVLEAFTNLPPWVQTAVLTGWGLNKLTGGLLTDLAGGLIKGVLGMTAGVVNIKAGIVNGGGIPGIGGGGKGGGGLLGGGGRLILGLTGVGLAAIIAEEVHNAIKPVGKTMTSDLQWPFGPANTPTILPEIFGGNGLLGGTGASANPSRGGDRPSPGNPGLVKGQLKEAVTAGTAGVTSAVKNAQSIASRENSAQKTELQNIKTTTNTGFLAQSTATAAQTLLQGVHAAGQAIRDATIKSATDTAGTKTANASRSAGDRTAGAMSSAASRIVGAIYAARPVINVTTVNRHTTTNNRYGPTGGSSNTSRTYSGQ